MQAFGHPKRRPGQSQILCNLYFSCKQRKIYCGRQRIIQLPLCAQYNVGRDGCQGQRNRSSALGIRAQRCYYYSGHCQSLCTNWFTGLQSTPSSGNSDVAGNGLHAFHVHRHFLFAPLPACDMVKASSNEHQAKLPSGKAPTTRVRRRIPRFRRSMALLVRILLVLGQKVEVSQRLLNAVRHLLRRLFLLHFPKRDDVSLGLFSCSPARESP